MDVFGHEDKCVQFIAPVAAIAIKSFQEEADIRFDNKQPRRERHKVSPWRGDESSRFQSKPQGLEAACLLSLNRHEWNSCPSR